MNKFRIFKHGDRWWMVGWKYTIINGCVRSLDTFATFKEAIESMDFTMYYYIRNRYA